MTTALNWLETRIASTAIYPPDKALEYLALGLTGEAGEVAEKIKKLIRDGHLDKEACILEVFDVLWYAIMLIRELGFSLDVAVAKGLEKLDSRKSRGVLDGNGDNR